MYHIACLQRDYILGCVYLCVEVCLWGTGVRGKVLYSLELELQAIVSHMT